MKLWLLIPKHPQNHTITSYVCIQWFVSSSRFLKYIFLYMYLYPYILVHCKEKQFYRLRFNFFLVCVLDFEVIQNHMTIDQSGNGNNGYFNDQVIIREHPQICGHYADLTYMGEVLFSAQTFIKKPKTGITIACWVNIQGDIAGKHSIFSTIRRSVENNYIGMYTSV